MKNATETPKLLVSMPTKDRQAINQMIQHKCDEFESVIQKGSVAMLNAQEESEKLAEKRAEYLSFLTSRNQQKKNSSDKLVRQLVRQLPKPQWGEALLDNWSFLLPQGQAMLYMIVLSKNVNKQKQKKGFFQHKCFLYPSSRY